ncbi:MAG: ABC transporter substrate-binding protein [Alphaproteobacteria bacterium]|nr:ABC transporter substrate-binding protein [Alphaproteobacteria bacterium]
MAKRMHAPGMAMMTWIAASFVAVVALVPGTSGAVFAAELTVQLNWVPTAAFAGYYHAKDAGLYEDRDLSVRLLHGGPDVNPIESVVSGRAQIGLTGAKRLLKARAAGQPVRAVAAIFQRSPVVFMSDAAKNLGDPRRFAGRTIRVTPDMVPVLQAVMSRVGVAEGDYRTVSLPSDPGLFDTGVADIWAGHITGLALRLSQMGHRLSYVFPSDYGVQDYGGVIFATEEYLAQNEEAVADFVAASLAGFQTIIENADMAGPLVQLRNPDADVAFQSARMAASVPLIHTGVDRLGGMTLEKWRSILSFEQRVGGLPEDMRAEDAFTLGILRTLGEG